MSFWLHFFLFFMWIILLKNSPLQYVVCEYIKCIAFERIIANRFSTEDHFMYFLKFMGVFYSLSPQFDVWFGSTGCQVLQSTGHHDNFLLSVDDLCCCGGGHRHGHHHPPGWSCPERGLRGQREAHHELRWCSTGPYPVSLRYWYRWSMFFT